MSPPTEAKPEVQENFTPLDRVLLAISGFLFAFTAYYASIKNINWDEFFFLSHIHSIARGESIQPLQTFYVRLFWWLPNLDGDEIYQVMVARGVFILLLGLSMYLIYRISRHFFSRTAGLFAVAVSLSTTNVINHGPSFRFDTLALVFLLFALFAILKQRNRWWIVSAISLALAILVTIKSVFFLPAIIAFAMVAATEENWSRGVLVRGTAFALTAAMVFGGLFLQHLMLLGLEPVSGSSQTATMLTHAGGTTLGEGVLVPRLPTLFHTMVQNPAQWLIILAGVVIAVSALWRQDRRWQTIAVLALALPLFTPLIYRNAFAYFYVMIIPPAAVATGYFVEAFRERAESRNGGSARALILMPVIIALVLSGKYYSSRLTDQRIAQRETIELVHALFPEPVPYIDRNAMVASFPKVGFFMSTWGVKDYRAKGEPQMRPLLEAEAPVFMLANTVLLDLKSGGGVDFLEERYLLMEEDFRTLQNNFVHFWGIVYLAGKHFEFTELGVQSFEILVPGSYTLEAEGEVVLNGQLLAPSSVVELGKGMHRIEATGGMVEATLIYGDNPTRPDRPRNPQQIYTGL